MDDRSKAVNRLSAHLAAKSAECQRLREALAYTLAYGTFDSAVDNTLHARALEKAREALRETQS